MRFFVNEAPSKDNLAITEINYNPRGNEPTEFIELQNIGANVIDLAGLRFSKGIQFDFTNGAYQTLAAGERILVVQNRDAFEARYGLGKPIAGEFTGSLSDSGETIKLLKHDGTKLLDVTYNDSGAWPGRADGLGSSLEAVTTSGDNDDPKHWRASTEVHGSPGTAGIGPISSVVINEVLTHTDLPQVDAIELFNPTGQTIDLSGWYLSDTNGDYKKFRIPNGTMLAPLSYLVFDETDFDSSGGTDPNDFRLDAAHGDNVWLVAADSNGTLTQFIDHVDFGAASTANRSAYGRAPMSRRPCQAASCRCPL